MIVGTPSNWSKDNARILAQFLSTGTGQLFLAHVAASRPALLADSTDPHAVALRAQLAAGYERAANNIFLLTEEPAGDQKPVKEGYPDLDDHSAWEQPTEETSATPQ